jgi:hypothetical protein
VADHLLGSFGNYLMFSFGDRFPVGKIAAEPGTARRQRRPRRMAVASVGGLFAALTLG